MNNAYNKATSSLSFLIFPKPLPPDNHPQTLLTFIFTHMDSYLTLKAHMLLYVQTFFFLFTTHLIWSDKMCDWPKSAIQECSSPPDQLPFKTKTHYIEHYNLKRCCAGQLLHERMAEKQTVAQLTSTGSHPFCSHENVSEKAPVLVESKMTQYLQN